MVKKGSAAIVFSQAHALFRFNFMLCFLSKLIELKSELKTVGLTLVKNNKSNCCNCSLYMTKYPNPLLSDIISHKQPYNPTILRLVLTG